MTTLIATIHADGRVHRCNANCYNARDPHCSCICGGINHGVGYWQATANLRTLAEPIALDILDRFPGEPRPEILYGPEVLHSTNPLLFDADELAACHPHHQPATPTSASTHKETSATTPSTAPDAAGS